MDREDLRKEIGHIIRAERERKGWTRYQLAHYAGIGETHLDKIEGGAYSIRVDILDRLCSTLEIEVTIPIQWGLSETYRQKAAKQSPASIVNSGKFV